MQTFELPRCHASVAVGLAVLTAIGVALIGRGTLPHQFLSLAGLFAFGIPLGVVLVVALLAKRRRIAVGALGALLALGLQIPLGHAIFVWDVDNAKRYCERVIPLLEHYKQAHGRYPPTLTELPGATAGRPHLVRRGRLYYRSDEQGFDLEIANDAVLFGGFRYSSDRPRWVPWVD